MNNSLFRSALVILLVLFIHTTVSAQFTGKLILDLGGFGIAEKIVAADFDGDGKVDVLTRDMGKELFWLKNNGSGTFTETPFTLPGSNLGGIKSVRAFDYDKDGDQDVVATFTDSYKGKVLLWANSGAGSFSQGVTIATNLSEVASLHTVDFDKDGDLDVALATPYERIKWIENKLPTTSWEVHEFAFDVTSGYLDIMDFDKNGTLDVLSISAGYGIRINGVTIDASLSTSNPRFIKAVDIDRDGDYDIIGCVQGFESGLLWYENKGDQFVKHVFENTVGRDYRAFTVFDFDSDGDEDFFATCWFDCGVTLYENTGGGTFAMKTLGGNGTLEQELIYADVDNDGKIDLLRNDAGFHIVLWMKNGQDQFTGLKSDFYYKGTCEDTSFEFFHQARGKNIVSWEWDFGDGSAKVTTPLSSHVFTTAGDFNVKLTVKNSNGDVSSVSKTVTVKPSPTRDADKLVAFCVKDFTSNVTVTLPEGFTYKWAYTEEGTIEFNTTPSYTFSGSAEVYVLKTDANGCSTSGRQKITVTASDYPFGPTTKGAVSFNGAAEVVLEATPGADEFIEWATFDNDEPYHVGNTLKTTVTETTSFYARSVNKAGCKSVLIPATVGIYSQPLSPAPEFIWTDPTQSELNTGAITMNTDGDGNFFALGTWFDKNFVVGDFTIPHGEDVNLFLIRYNKDGVALDAKKLAEGSGYWSYHNFAVDTDMSIYLTMVAYNSIKIGGTEISAPEYNKDYGVIAKLDSDGKYVWHKIIQPNGPKVKLTNDHVIVTTSYYATYISALSKTDGDLTWDSSLGSMYTDDLDIDNSGNIFLSGTTQGNINNAVVVKYSPSGELLWQKEIVTGGTLTRASNIMIDANNNIVIHGTYVTGYTPSDSYISILGKKIGGGNGMFIVKATNDGEAIWVKEISGSIIQRTELNVGGNGDILITGFCDRDLSFDGIVFPPGQRGYVAKYTSDGEFRWVRGTSKVDSYAVAADEEGGAIMYGEFPDEVYLDDIYVRSPVITPFPVIHYNSVTARLGYKLKAEFTSEAACSNAPTRFQSMSTAESGSALVEWNWDFGDGGTSTEQHPKHTYANGGSYTVKLTVKDNLNRTMSKTGSVNVSGMAASPQVIIESPSSACKGSSINYKANVSNAGLNFFLNWYVDGVIQATASGSNTFDFIADQQREVKVVVDAPSLQCVLTKTAQDSKTVVLTTVPAKPVIEAADTEFCEGGSTTISTSSTAAVYVWSTGASTSKITANTNGSYSLKIGNNADCLSDSSEPIEIVVNENPAKPTVTVQGNVLLSSAASSYKWYHDDVLIDETHQQFSAETSGLYKVEVFSAAGCSNVSDEVNVNITVTGLEKENSTEVIVSPNPVRDKLFIHTSNKINSVKLIDIFGRSVLDGGQSNVVDISSVAAGAYLLMIDTGSGTITKRVIKM